MQNVATYNLPNDLWNACLAAEGILKQQEDRLPIEVQLSVTATLLGEERLYQSRRLVIHNANASLALLRSDIDDWVLHDMCRYPDSDNVPTPYEGFQWLSHKLFTNDHKMGQTTCPVCSKSMSSKNFPRHFRVCGGQQGCSVCCRVIPDDIASHRGECSVRSYGCRVEGCHDTFNSGQRRKAHENKCRGPAAMDATPRSRKRARLAPDTPRVRSSGLNRIFRIVEIPLDVGTDHEGALRLKRDQIEQVIEDESTHGIKCYIGVEIRMSKKIGGEVKTCSFTSAVEIFTSTSDIKTLVGRQCEALNQKVEEFLRNGSGWAVEAVEYITLHMTTYNPLGAGSYIKTPTDLPSGARSILNVQNMGDEKCLAWCIAADRTRKRMGKQAAAAGVPFVGLKNASRSSNYVDEMAKLDLTGINFPATTKDIDRMEEQNDLCINVIGYAGAEEGYFPTRVSNSKSNDIVNLLLITDNFTQHYILVTNLSGLLSYNNAHEHKKNYCLRCFKGFAAESNLQKHLVYCSRFKPQRTSMPEEKILKFSSFRKTVRHPLFITCDFECIAEPVECNVCTVDVECEGCRRATKNIVNFKPISYSLKLCADDKAYDLPIEHYQGEDCVSHLLARVDELAIFVNPLLYRDVKMIKPTTLEMAQFNKVKNCYLCHGMLGNKRDLDHDHQTGVILGVAHPACNRERRTEKYLPVLFHNLAGFDGHLIITKLVQREMAKPVPGNIHVIPKTAERYLAIMTRKVRYMDTLAHLNSSLERLVEDLKLQGTDSFVNLKEYVKNQHGGGDEMFKLLLRKGVFPYGYLDSKARLAERGLPPRSAFYNQLTEESISEENYLHAHRVFSAFSCSTLGDYCRLYNDSDVALLADVYEAYRALCLEYYELDPLHYFTSPSLTWDAGLKFTGVELELLTEPRQYMFMECALRGGVSTITKRYALANNPLCADYDPNKATTYLIYLDANNLYGYSMMRKLPHSKFRWGTVTKADIMNYKEDADWGCFVKVDIDIPDGVHEKLSDMPPCPESLDIDASMASPTTATHRREVFGVDHRVPTQKKLAPNLLPKRGYICHISTLKHYLELGAKLLTVHEALLFTQSAWLKPYIMFNTEKRMEADSEFKRSFFKLMINSFFGKTCESVRRYKEVKFVTNSKQQRRQVSKPTFKNFQIFSDGVVGVELLQCNIVLNKPIYTGVAILDFAKEHMSRFWYDTLKERYGSNIRLCFTDTDSLLFEVATEDFYKDMASFADKLDLSKYPVDSPLHSTINHCVPGKMKDECSGDVIEEFIGLRSKSYTIKLKHRRKLAAAGVKRCVADKHLTHGDYKAVLMRKTKKVSVQQTTIQSKKHILHLVQQERAALSPVDDKRWVLEDGINTRPHGHWLNAYDAADIFNDSLNTSLIL